MVFIDDPPIGGVAKLHRTGFEGAAQKFLLMKPFLCQETSKRPRPSGGVHPFGGPQ
jgi:hypothetical protein